MGEGTEVDDRVDLDEENYMEEMEDDAEEDPEDDAGDAHDEEIAKDGYEELKEEGGQQDQSPDADKNTEAVESVESEQRPSSPVNEPENEKHALLLSLPPHGPDLVVLAAFNRGAIPSAMQMVPMVLPGGRIGYVLQQPDMQMPHPRQRRFNRNSGPGRAGSNSDEGHRSKRYRPY